MYWNVCDLPIVVIVLFLIIKFQTDLTNILPINEIIIILTKRLVYIHPQPRPQLLITGRLYCHEMPRDR